MKDLRHDVVMVYGLSGEDLIEIRKRLNILGIDLKDLIHFLDQDKVQLFARQEAQIKYLKRELKEVFDKIDAIEFR